MGAGLVKRMKGKYVLTEFGTVIYEVQLSLAVGVNNRSKLMAFDLLYSTDTIPVSKRANVMSQIINYSEKTEIILKTLIHTIK